MEVWRAVCQYLSLCVQATEYRPLILILKDKPKAETSRVNRALRCPPSLLGIEPSRLVLEDLSPPLLEE